VKRRQAKAKGPDAKKSRLSSPPGTAESPLENGLSPSSSGELTPSSAKLVKKPGGKLVQAKLPFAKDSGKENVKSPSDKTNSGNTKTAAKSAIKDLPKGDKKTKKVESEKGKKETGDKTKKDSADSAKVNEKVKKNINEKAKKDNSEKAKKDSEKAKKDSEKAKKDNSEKAKKDSEKTKKTVKAKNEGSSTPNKATPKVLKRTLSKISARSVSVSPMKGSPRSSSQESTRSSRGLITVKFSPKKKSLNAKKKNIKVVSKKTGNSSPQKLGVNKKSGTKSSPAKPKSKPSPVKSNSTPNKKSVTPRNKPKASQSKAVNGKNAKKPVSSPSKSVSSMSSLRSGPASSPRNSKAKVSKSPAPSPKVGQKRPAGGNSRNASPAKKGKPTPPPAKNVK
jgi:hypothetical protein